MCVYAREAAANRDGGFLSPLARNAAANVVLRLQCVLW